MLFLLFVRLSSLFLSLFHVFTKYLKFLLLRSFYRIVHSGRVSRKWRNSKFFGVQKNFVLGKRFRDPSFTPSLGLGRKCFEFLSSSSFSSLSSSASLTDKDRVRKISNNLLVSPSFAYLSSDMFQAKSLFSQSYAIFWKIFFLFNTHLHIRIQLIYCFNSHFQNELITQQNDDKSKL